MPCGRIGLLPHTVNERGKLAVEDLDLLMLLGLYQLEGGSISRFGRVRGLW